MTPNQIAEVVPYATANRSRAKRMIKAMLKADAEDNGNGNGNGNALANSPISHLADLLCEAGEFPDRADALRYLLRSKHGTGMMTRLGPRALAAKRADNTSAAVKALDHISEHAFTKIVTEHAKERYPNDRPDVAFSKVYNEGSDEGMAIRAARQQIKQRQFVAECRKRLPFEVNTTPRESDSAEGALEQLRAMAAEQRKLARGTSPSTTGSAAD
jgi:hypothetical protein